VFGVRSVCPVERYACAIVPSEAAHRRMQLATANCTHFFACGRRETDRALEFDYPESVYSELIPHAHELTHP